MKIVKLLKNVIGFYRKQGKLVQERKLTNFKMNARSGFQHVKSKRVQAIDRSTKYFVLNLYKLQVLDQKQFVQVSTKVKDSLTLNNNMKNKSQWLQIPQMMTKWYFLLSTYGIISSFIFHHNPCRLSLLTVLSPSAAEMKID
jgi:hypothetical protein